MANAKDVASTAVVLGLVLEARKRAARLAVRDPAGGFARVEQALGFAEALLRGLVPTGVQGLVGEPPIVAFTMTALETSGN